MNLRNYMSEKQYVRVFISCAPKVQDKMCCSLPTDHIEHLLAHQISNSSVCLSLIKTLTLCAGFFYNTEEEKQNARTTTCLEINKTLKTISRMGKKSQQCKKLLYEDSQTPEEGTRDVQFTDTTQISFCLLWHQLSHWLCSVDTSKPCSLFKAAMKCTLDQTMAGQ